MNFNKLIWSEASNLMLLRFKKPIASSPLQTSHNPTQGRNPFGETSYSMDNFAHLLRRTIGSEVPTWKNIGGMEFNKMLVYMGFNKHGAKLYSDPLNKITMKTWDITSPTDNVVWVNDQGDHFIDQDGESYVITLDPENMNKMQNLISIGHATSKVPVTMEQERRGMSYSWRVPNPVQGLL